METEAAPEPSDFPLWKRLIFGGNPAWTVARIAVVVIVTVVVFAFVLVPIKVTGNSMAPNYTNGQIKFVNKLAYLRQKPQRGDVVAVKFYGRQVLLLKRIVAVPGDTISVHEGQIYIDGALLEEPYANGRIPSANGKGYGTLPPVKIGPGEYVVTGDNRPVSEHFKKSEDEIIGKVL